MVHSNYQGRALMVEKDPVEEFTEEIIKILGMVREEIGKGSLKGEIPADTFARIAKLENDVAYFRQATSQRNLPEEEGVGELTARQKRILERIKALRTEAVTLILTLRSQLGPKDEKVDIGGEREGKPTKSKSMSKKKNWMKL